MPILNIAPNMLLRTGLYGMYRNIYSISGVEESVISTEQLHYIAESTLVYNSSVGAFSLSLSKFDFKDWNNLYLTFGLGIPIFAPKGTFY